jgi:transcriptional regulator with XRE-family HTH domain
MSPAQDFGDHVSPRVAVTLADAIRASGRTTLEVSSLVGMEPSTLARRLSGHGRLHAGDAERIAAVVGLTVSELVDLAERRRC